MLMMLSKPDVAAAVTFGMKSFHLIERILRRHRIWNALWTLIHMRLLSVDVSRFNASVKFLSFHCYNKFRQRMTAVKTLCTA